MVDILNAYPDTASSSFYYAWGVWGIMSICQVTAGFSLWKFRTPRAVQVAIIMIWASWLVDILSGVLLDYFAGTPLLNLAQENQKVILKNAVTALIWTMYLLKSRRVRNTYYGA